MKLVTLAVGIPGSGKTTLLVPFAERFGMQRINRDTIRQELFGDPYLQGRNDHVRAQVRAEANLRMEQALKSGKSVVLDSIFVDAKDRRNTIAQAKALGAERVVGVVFLTPLEQAMQWNKKRRYVVAEDIMTKLYEKLLDNPPSLEDGFDALYTSTNIDELIANELS